VDQCDVDQYDVDQCDVDQYDFGRPRTWWPM
jgi:hypothetical protein